jgi:GT2 family glycosyltransferase
MVALEGGKVGLLWDSASPNMGDQAIGLVLRRLLTSRGLQPIPVDPFAPGDLASLDALLIGGGDLIRAPGHPYYDTFRARGACILCTAGISDGSDTGYLEDYVLVTVRSEADQERLGRGEVVPCLTMLMGDHLEPQGDLPELPPNAIGLHVNFALGDACYDLARWLQEQDLGPVVFLPLTHYNADFLLMQAIHRHLPASILLPPLAPDEAFQVIGQLRGLITSSLHGAIFAYSQNIPFMALTRISKIQAFLEDRGVRHLGFDEPTEIISRFPGIVTSAAVVPDLVNADKDQCRRLLDRICAICDAGKATRARPRGFQVLAASHFAHEKEMELYWRQGETAAHLLQSGMSMVFRQSQGADPAPLAPVTPVRSDLPGPAMPGKSYSSILVEVDALRRERSLLMNEIARHRSELWETRDLLARHLRSWPGKLLLAYWKAVNQLVPYGSRRRWMAKRMRNVAGDLLRGSPYSARIRPIRPHGTQLLRRPDRATLSQTSLAEPVQLSVADPGYAVLVDRTEPSDHELRSQRESAAAWNSPEAIELVTEVRGSSLQELLETIRAVKAQTNPYWLLQIVLAPSVPSEIRSHLKSEAHSDPRMRLRTGPSDYWTAPNLKAALEGTESRFIAFLKAGDLLAPHALFRFAEALQREPEAEIVYCDFDHVVPSKLRAEPLFKPDWSPETMLSYNLLANMFIFERRFLTRIGFPDVGMGDAFLWDFALGLAREAKRVLHLPEVLLHVTDSHELPTREISEVIHQSHNEAAALRSHLRRQGLRFPEVEVGLDGRSRVKWALSREWRVSVIIPTKDNRQILERCIDSLLRRTDYKPLEVIIVDTGSSSPDVAEYYRSLEDVAGVMVEHLQGKFNFGKACNRGASLASGDLLLFLNNDTEALDRDWLLRMVQWFEIEEIGVVGGKLLYPDGRIQHAGVIVGMGGLASHVFLLSEEGEPTIFGSTEWYRNYSAVTAACLMVRRRTFEAVHGFDEEFVVNYSDVDLCLRIRDSGLRIVYTPDARLLHHESYSHRRKIPRGDFERAGKLWMARGDLHGDPYFNPCLSYMNPHPDYRRMDSDNPEDLTTRLMRRLPRRAILSLPDDIS